jgi:DNA-binding transcriptional LysR family regulator
MRAPRLSTTDLNLLVAFDALVAEGNVTRAADRVGLTQPAMSHALGRLRKLVGDPLFVRTSQGMVPTPRAAELVEPIRRALGEIDRALFQPPRFDPGSATRSFNLAAVDFGALVVLPPLLARVRVEAPHADLVVRQLRADTIEQQLVEGEVDVAVGMVHDEPPWMAHRKLFEERFICLARQGHPVVKGAISLEQFVALEHALVAPRQHRSAGFVDRALAKRGLRRRVALTLPHFLVAPFVVASSDLVLTLPGRVARTFAGMMDLQLVQPPLEVEQFFVSAYWHERQTRDPAHGWLREVLVDVCKNV